MKTCYRYIIASFCWCQEDKVVNLRSLLVSTQDYSLMEKHRGLRADRLIILRKAMHLSQQQLNDLCQFTAGQIARYENGHSDPLPPQLSQLAKVLDVTADFLLGISDDPEGGRKEQLSNTEKLILAKFRGKDYYGAIAEIATHATIEAHEQNSSKGTSNNK